MATELTIKLLTLHSLQQEIINHPARFKVVACGRRVGKTELSKDILANAVIETSLPYAYFAPTYKSMREVWESVKSTLAPLVKKVHEQEKRLEFITGATLDFWSLDKVSADTARGRKYAGVILDEAARVANLEITWNEVIRAMLMDYSGWALFLSTPKGRNFFWQIFQRGLDPLQTDWMCWQRPTTDNPHIPVSEIEAAKTELPSRAFSQEIMAEFLEDAGTVFRGVSAVSIALPCQPVQGHSYVGGLDWGRSEDFTVLSILDETTNTQVHIERFNTVGYHLQRGRIKAVCDQFKPRLIVAEQNSIGEPNIEMLQKDGLPVEPFVTTNASKGQIIDALALVIERKEVTLLNDPVQVAELQSYEMERLPGGSWRYSAPDGGHDDTVIALALAWYAAQQKPQRMSFAPAPKQLTDWRG